MKKTLLFITLFLGISKTLICQNIVYSDNFTQGISNWTIEAESDSFIIKTEDRALEIIAPKGLTLWFNKSLETGIKISFDAFIINNKGKFDRISDLNCFWMANDPENPNDFFARSKWRQGTFGKYYSLTMYYVGYGGNNNTTSRFRKYDGSYEGFKNKATRPDIIKEYNDSAHLIVPNKWDHIEIVMNRNNIKYIFNNETLFDYNDTTPYNKGYFGLRTVTNHMKIKDFEVRKL